VRDARREGGKEERGRVGKRSGVACACVRVWKRERARAREREREREGGGRGGGGGGGGGERERDINGADGVVAAADHKRMPPIAPCITFSKASHSQKHHTLKSITLSKGNAKAKIQGQTSLYGKRKNLVSTSEKF
jgi:hypothetical protein